MHVGLNTLGQEDTMCTYDNVGTLLMSSIVFTTHLVQTIGSEVQSAHAEFFLVLADLLSFVPGLWFMMSTKPADEGWFGEVGASGCSLKESGYGQLLFLLGSLLTFGTAIRVAIVARFGQSYLNTAIIIIAAFAFQFSVGTFAEWVKGS